MVVKVSLKNTFLMLESRDSCSGSKRRSYSEETIRRFPQECSSLKHLEQLWCETAPFQELKHQADVQVFQSDCSLPEAGVTKSRLLGKMGPVSSLSSVSTMASDDDSDSSWKFGLFGSSNSLSSMAWCDEEDEFPLSDDSVQCKPQSSQHSSCEIQATPKDSKHCLVPRNVNLAEEFAKTKKGGQAITTLMIRNIPNRCSQRELIGELERVGFAGCFDFVYVPLDLGTMSNVGYAFVNFIHPTYASRCMEMLPKHQFSRQRKSGKPVAVSPAHMQGLEANLRHYEKSAVNTSRLRQRRPVVMNILKTVSLASLI
jgi:hypothetical protein